MFSTLRGFGLRRNTDDRWLAGVCSGIADRMGIDLLFVGGIGGLAYLVAWALLPDQNGKILAEEALHGDGWGIALLVVIGIALISNVANRWWLWTILLPVGLLLWWAIHSARQGKSPEQMSEEARQFGNRVAATFTRPPAGSEGPGTAASESPVSPGAPPQVSSMAGDPAPPAVPPHGMGPGRTGTVVAPERVVHRPRPRGGFLGLLLTAGLAVAGYGLGKWFATTSGFEGSPEVLAAGFGIAGAGLALLLLGLTGRRAGFTTFLVTLAALATVAATSIPALPSGGFGEREWVAQSQPSQGFTLTAGEARLVLDGATAGSTVRVAMGAGQLNVTVPKGTTATFVPTIRAGQVIVNRPQRAKEVRSGIDTENGQPITVGGGATPVRVEITMAAGEVVITEES
jgi:phage shock protein PspC (stress-responsive transcriptional regulator)